MMRFKMPGSRSSRRRGSVVIGVLFFLLIMSMLLLGVGSYATSHQQRTTMDTAYAQAMDLAEAGVNYEFRKISGNAASADQASSPLTVSLGSGTYTVWCTSTDGVSNWTVGQNNLYVWATGTVNGVTRTIKVSAVGSSGPADFAIFALNTGTLNGTAMNVNGSVGTNGTLNFNGHPGVTGTVSFNGSGSGWAGSDPGGYPVTYSPDPIPWPTVDELVVEETGRTLAQLATNNDNALCPNIASNQIVANGNVTVTLTGKAGGANYYLTRMTFNGNARLVLNNTAGPINIWIGPSGGSGSCTISGGVAAVSMTSDPARGVRLYCGTTSGVTLNGNCSFDGGIYAYNRNSLGAPIGRITNNGNPVVNGSLISPTVTLNGNPTVNYVDGYFDSDATGYYGFNNSYQEINLPNFR